MQRVQLAYRCAPIDTTCGLEFSDEAHHGLVVDALRGHPHVQIRWRCRGCKLFRCALPDQVLAKWNTQPRDQVETCTIDRLRKAATRPCKGCGKSSWDIDVLWPDTTTMGWRVAHPGS